MVLFNHATREMTANIVYYGPGLCGKTTNLLVIFDKLDPKSRGKMLSLATKTDRTLFFDLLPVDIGKVGAFNLKIQLYTVPGQVFYNETRKLVLKGADAVVFVADSQPSMVSSNRDSFENLLENLQVNQLDPNDTPIVIQYNKRDIPGVLSIEELQEKLSLDGYPYVEASAVQGEGVMETFKLVSKIAAKHLLAKLQGKPKSSSKKAGRVPEATPSEPSGSAPLEPDFITPLSEAPFDSAPDAQAYEKVEEVSLEELLEGRERPATLSGSVPLPVAEEEVEALEERHMLPTVEAPAEPAELLSPLSLPEREDDSNVEASGSELSSPSLPPVGSGELDGLRRELDQLRGEQQQLRAALAEIASSIQRVLAQKH